MKKTSCQWPSIHTRLRFRKLVWTGQDITVACKRLQAGKIAASFISALSLLNPGQQREEVGWGMEMA